MLIPLGFLGAGGDSNSFELISTTVLDTSSASVTLGSIPSTYSHLQVRVSVAGTSGATLYARFNGDTGTNYSSHRLEGNGSTNSSTVWTTYGFMFLGSVSTTPYFNAGIFDVVDYTKTSKNKTVRSLTGLITASDRSMSLYGSFWKDTSVVSSITLYPNSGSFIAGSRFSIYGIKG